MFQYNLALLYQDIFKENQHKKALHYSSGSSFQTTSFKDLGKLANQIANYLFKEVGCRRGVVAILNDK